MALDPRILLALQGSKLDISPAIAAFQNTRNFRAQQEQQDLINKRQADADAAFAAGAPARAELAAAELANLKSDTAANISTSKRAEASAPIQNRLTESQIAQVNQNISNQQLQNKINSAVEARNVARDPKELELLDSQIAQLDQQLTNEDTAAKNIEAKAPFEQKLLEAQATKATEEAETLKLKREGLSALASANNISKTLTTGGFDLAIKELEENIATIIKNKGNPIDSQIALRELKRRQADNDIEGAKQFFNDAVTNLNNRFGKTKTIKDTQRISVNGKPANKLTYTDGTTETVLFGEGEERVNTLGQTAAQKTAAELELEQKKADIGLKTAEQKKLKELKAERTSKKRTELSERNRNSIRSNVKIQDALTIMQDRNPDSGLTASAKIKLSRLFPDIDVTDEVALESIFNKLALDELQNFSGPTTDFEFGVTKNIAGTILDPVAANIARVNSLKRNNWFAQREFKQFNDFIKNGGDADEFSFDMNEPIKTNKGEFTLEQIRNTAVFNHISMEDALSQLNKKG